MQEKEIERIKLTGEKLETAVDMFLERLKEAFLQRQQEKIENARKTLEPENEINARVKNSIQEFVGDCVILKRNLLSESPLNIGYVGHPSKHSDGSFSKALSFSVQFVLSFCEQGIFVQKVECIEDSSDVEDSDIFSAQSDVSFQNLFPLITHDDPKWEMYQKLSGVQEGEVFSLDNFYGEYSIEDDGDRFVGNRIYLTGTSESVH